MFYHYNIGGKKTQCFYRDGEFVVDDEIVCGIMTTYDDLGESGEHKVRKDDDGNRYFMVNGEKTMFDDYICYTPSELVANLSKCRDYNLCQTLMKYGMDSVRVMLRKKKLMRYDFGGGLVIGFDTSSPRDKVEDLDWVEYKFVNEDFSDPKDCYKLKMIPVDKKLREVYGSERTYASDLVSLMAKRTDLYQVKASV